MSAEQVPLFTAYPVGEPARFAAGQRRLFTGRNLHIGRSRTVHAVGWTDWINGLSLPAPACHQGWSGLGAAGELIPTRFPITCRKCHRLHNDQPNGDEPPALFPVPSPLLHG